MNNTQKLLNLAQQKVQRRSRESLAREMGVDRANLNRMFRGKGYPNAEHCVVLAALLEMDVSTVISQIGNDKKEARLEKLLDMTTKVAMVLIATSAYLHFVGETMNEFARNSLHLH